MNNIFIRYGHGYEEGSRGRCEAFDGFDIIANPLGGFDNDARESRHFPRPDGRSGVTYDSHAIWLARQRHDGALYILVHHGAGRVVLRVPEFYDNGDLDAHIRGMPDRLQYALLYTIYKTANYASEQARRATSHEWAAAYAEKRIRRRRASKTRPARVEIIPQWELELKAKAAAQAL